MTRQFVDRPVQLLWGLKDWVFDGDYYEEFRRRFPRAEALAWEDAGHLVLEDAGEGMIERVVAALEA